MVLYGQNQELLDLSHHSRRIFLLTNTQTIVRGSLRGIFFELRTGPLYICMAPKDYNIVLTRSIISRIVDYLYP